MTVSRPLLVPGSASIARAAQRSVCGASPFRKLPPFSFPLTSASRIQQKVSQQFFLCKARTYESEIALDHDLSTIPSSLLTAEREEAKAVLTLFLRKQGLSNTVSARIINKSDRFIDHLILKLQSIYKSRYLVGRELTTLEIRDALIPYLEWLHKEYGDLLIDFVGNFPDPPGAEPSASTVPKNCANSDSKIERAIARVSQLNSDGHLPDNVLYLVNLGVKLEQIKDIIRKFPAFAYYSLDRKIKPVVEFLLELGVPQPDIPTILIKRPQLCGISMSENLKPMMTYLENFGVDKNKWGKVIYRFPALLTYSRQKVKTTVDYLSELGVSEQNIGKILTRCPHIISYSVEDKLKPTADYLESIGINVASVVHKCPQTFGLSVEANLKPITVFFLQRGYSKGEVSTMVNRYGALYTFSLAGNLIPKWNYFLTMDYPKSELVKFPHYFGYSLEERIKPRYSRVRDYGVKLVLNQVLSVSDSQFEKVLAKKLDKLVDARFSRGVML
ncbi:transcription termination factor MTERF5, chloroplastic-like [Zingiber officinale]|uniref:transcription termination factor MTERF5, chloroplastic-like n=1 Tax=Zingiber officinale TaxID=94328 RepID=UPI001C4CDB5A|nr:transcription termination factor MTERF5, chloroplastic-like [Zingiber officinale]